MIRKPIKLLVVDDHHNYTELIEHAADMWNEHYRFECEIVESAESALQKIIDFAPTIVLADIHMADMDTGSFIEECKNRSVPLVVTSDHVLPTFEESTICKGARAYLPKTDDPEEMDYILEQLAVLSEENELTH